MGSAATCGVGVGAGVGNGSGTETVAGDCATGAGNGI